MTGRDQQTPRVRRPRRSADREQTLRRLVIAVAVAGVIAAATTVLVADEPTRPVPAWVPPALALLVLVSSAAAVRVRLRSTVAVMTWTDAAILVCIVCLPPAWVPICVAAGVAGAKLLRRVAPVKVAYNAGKDVLAATAGLAVAVLVGASSVTDPLARPAQVLLVAATVTLTQHLIGMPVLALASSTRWTRLVRVDADIRVASLVGKVAGRPAGAGVLAARRASAGRDPAGRPVPAPDVREPGPGPHRARRLAAVGRHHRGAQRHRPRGGPRPRPW